MAILLVVGQEREREIHVMDICAETRKERRRREETIRRASTEEIRESARDEIVQSIPFKEEQGERQWVIAFPFHS